MALTEPNVYLSNRFIFGAQSTLDKKTLLMQIFIETRQSNNSSINGYSVVHFGFNALSRFIKRIIKSD